MHYFLAEGQGEPAGQPLELNKKGVTVFRDIQF
jgi:hypothetical protein